MATIWQTTSKTGYGHLVDIVEILKKKTDIKAIYRGVTPPDLSLKHPSTFILKIDNSEITGPFDRAGYWELRGLSATDLDGVPLKLDTLGE